MLKFVPCLIFTLLLAAGCTANTAEFKPVSTRVIVAEAEILAYLDRLEISPYHDLKPAGTEIFQPGRHIPVYRRIFDDYPAQELPEGQIRYDLLVTEGETGTAWIYLFLDQDSGRIVEFSAGEATF